MFLGIHSDVDAIARLHKYELLPESDRKQVVSEICIQKVIAKLHLTEFEDTIAYSYFQSHNASENKNTSLCRMSLLFSKQPRYPAKCSG